MPQVRVVTPDGPAIRAARKELGLTIEQLAARMGGRAPMTVWRIERGKLTRASRVLINQFALALDKPVEELILQDAA